MHFRIRTMITNLITIVACMLLVVGCGLQDEKVSRFGKYEGFSERQFDSFVRESKYVPVRDGTRLAIDIYFPANGGVKAEEQFPVLINATKYVKRKVSSTGEMTTMLRIEDGHSQSRVLLEHGYIIVAVDVRGSGASFGEAEVVNPKYNQLALDMYDVIEWSAKQSWSTGKTGMFGGSYMGGVQMFVASAAPPSLNAIMPVSHYRDMFGPYVTSASQRYMAAVAAANDRDQDVDETQVSKEVAAILRADEKTAPVDGPDGEALLEQALRERQRGELTVNQVVLRRKEFYKEQRTDFFRTSDVRASGIPVYSWGGLYDSQPMAPVWWVSNLDSQSRAVVGPWTHGFQLPNAPESRVPYTLLTIESLRWFDYWLKGVNNGVLDEPAIKYAIENDRPDQWAWFQSDQWPSETVRRQDYYLGQENDDWVLRTRPDFDEAAAQFVVDYSATTGTSARSWSGLAQGGIYSHPEMSALNHKGLIFTSAPFTEDRVIAGAPIVDLQMQSTAADGDVHVFVEKVMPDGRSLFVVEGMIMASWRQLAEAPYENFGWPYLAGTREAIEATPDFNAGVARLNFALKPTGAIFEKGTRLRIAITGADKDNVIPDEELDPPPELTVFTGGPYVSRISIPFVTTEKRSLQIQNSTEYPEK